MLRLLGIATLILMAVCLAVGASIALANADATPATAPEQRKVEAVDPDRLMIDHSLAAIAPSDISNQDI
jgi:hypothetical protein